MYFLIAILSIVLIISAIHIVKLYVEWITALFIITENKIDVDEEYIKEHRHMAITFIIENAKKWLKNW